MVRVGLDTCVVWGTGPVEARDVRPIYDQVEIDHCGELEGGQLLTGGYGREMERSGKVCGGVGDVSMRESEIIMCFNYCKYCALVMCSLVS